MTYPTSLQKSIGKHEGRPALFSQRCRSCKTTLYPVSGICAACGSSDVERVPLSAQARVFSWTVIHRAGAGLRVPYIVALADFPEGPRLFAQVAADPSTMRCGLPVRVQFGDAPAGAPADAYFFAPA